MPLELPFFYGSPQWHEARDVLDLGTGNGYYLQKIASRFPDKSYLGIDISEDLIEIATRENSRANVRFICGDLFEFEGAYDVVILRLVLQHLPDVDKVLKKVARITKQGGSVLVIEAHDPSRMYWPDVPLFMRFFRAYAAYQASLGLDRTVAARLPEIIENHPCWAAGSAAQVIVPSTLPGNLDLFRKSYGLFIELVEHGSDMTYDFDSVRREWQRWCDLDYAYTQAGLNIVRLDRV